MLKPISNFISSIKNKFEVSKRQQFVIVTLFLTLCLIATQLFSGGLRLDILIILASVTYVLSAIVLRQELSGWEFVTLLTLPTLYTTAVFLFYFLLPTRWLTRLPIAALYALGMYAILLTENIYNVAAERNIQLIRAAQSVGFLISIITIFFLLDAVYSLRLPYWTNMLLSLIIAFPLILQALWSVELTGFISNKVILGSLIIAFVISQSALVFSFWPVRPTIEALFIATIYYSLVGMTQQFLLERLFTKTLREYLSVFVLVFILVVITTKWGISLQ